MGFVINVFELDHGRVTAGPLSEDFLWKDSLRKETPGGEKIPRTPRRADSIITENEETARTAAYTLAFARKRLFL